MTGAGVVVDVDVVVVDVIVDGEVTNTSGVLFLLDGQSGR